MKFLTLGLAATLAFSAAQVQAASPITFTITAESSAGVLTPGNMFNYSSFEGGDKLNVQTVLRDETYTYGNARYVYHWADRHYDRQGGYRDDFWWTFDRGDAALAPDYVYFKASAVSNPNAHQTVPMTIKVSSYLSGTYSLVADPRFPNVSIQPGPVTVASADSHNPADLISLAGPHDTFFNADGTFFVGGYRADKIIPAGGAIDMSVLFYMPHQLHATSYSFYLGGSLYDEGLHHFSDTDFLGYEILPVPEPSTWAMLLAGVGILGVARRRKTAA